MGQGGQTRARRGAALLLIAVASGCATDASNAPNAPMRTSAANGRPVDVADLRDPSMPQQFASMDPSAASHRFIAQRLVFERDAPRLLLATNMLKDVAVDPVAAANWANNNLHLGRLERNRLPLFLANLPKPLSNDVVRIFNPTIYSPLTLVDRLQGVQRVRLVAPNGRARLVKLVGGEYQLLLKTAPPLDPLLGPAKLEVLPHHFGAAATLLPRGNGTLDGTSFHDFRLELPIDDDYVWIVWSTLPPEVQETSSASNNPISLGEAMLSGNLRSKPVQAVVIIATER